VAAADAATTVAARAAVAVVRTESMERIGATLPRR